MSDAGRANRAAELAREFDRGFAEPRRAIQDDFEEFLAIRAAGDPYAVRLRDITGLIADRKIVPVPTAEPSLLGLAGLRGGVVPVYSLAALLGRGGLVETPRWLLLVGTEAPVGLAFTEFDGHVRIGRDHVSSGADPTAPETVRIAEGRRGIVGVGALADTIRKRHPEIRTHGGKER